jgi:hypothetical protein
MRKRDGPATRATSTGPRVVDERAVLLPRLKSLRKSARTASPHQHHRPRRRRQDRWRGWSIRVFAPPNADGAHALYLLLLRLAAQRFGLQVGDVRELRFVERNLDSDEKT